MSLIIGKNAQNNWDILKKYKKINKSYLWFHLDGFSSPYVILEKEYNKVSKQEIIYACQACKDNSKYKNMEVKIVYTTLKNIIKGNEIGQAIIKSKKKCNYITL